MKDITEFLKLNGFVQTIENPNIFCNAWVAISIHESKVYFEVYDVRKGTFMYSEDLSLYWLIGLLTYYGYMDKNYKQLA